MKQCYSRRIWLLIITGMAVVDAFLSLTIHSQQRAFPLSFIRSTIPCFSTTSIIPELDQIIESIDSRDHEEYYLQVQDWLFQHNISFVHRPHTVTSSSYHSYPHSQLLEIAHRNLTLHLIPTPSHPSHVLPPRFKQQLTDDHQELASSSSSSRPKIIHLHQDTWINHQPIFQSRLLTQMKSPHRRLYARQTTCRRIPRDEARAFLQEHHLWGATQSSKYQYGLFVESKQPQSHSSLHTTQDATTSTLVAVATFSPRRKVQRSNHTFASHELLRFGCAQYTTIVGGISKCITHFCRDVQPDDIVTVVDRDWGPAVGWESVGFETVAILDPIVMAVKKRGGRQEERPAEGGDSTIISQERDYHERFQLVGAGIQQRSSSSDPNKQRRDKGNPHRQGLPLEVLEELHQWNDTQHDETPQDILERHGYYLIHDAGVERLLLVVDPALRNRTQTLWKESVPHYAASYYSPNPGIADLLEQAARS